MARKWTVAVEALKAGLPIDEIQGVNFYENVRKEKATMKEVGPLTIKLPRGRRPMVEDQQVRDIELVESWEPADVPWIEQFTAFRNPYCGYVDSHEKVCEVIKEFEYVTHTKFVIRNKTKNYGKDYEDVRAECIENSKSPTVFANSNGFRFNWGIKDDPFVTMGRHMRECRYGCMRHKSKKLREMDGDNPLRHRWSKKLGCTANINVAHVVVFPKFKFDPAAKGAVRHFMLEMLKDVLVSQDELEHENRFFIFLPRSTQHTNHVAGEEVVMPKAPKKKYKKIKKAKRGDTVDDGGNNSNELSIQRSERRAERQKAKQMELLNKQRQFEALLDTLRNKLQRCYDLTYADHSWMKMENLQRITELTNDCNSGIDVLCDGFTQEEKPSPRKRKKNKEESSHNPENSSSEESPVKIQETEETEETEVAVQNLEEKMVVWCDYGKLY